MIRDILNWVPLGLLLPMLIGAAGVWLLVRGKDPTRSMLPPVGWSLAIGLGATVGMLALMGLPPWKPVEAHHWVLIAVLPISGIVGLMNMTPRFPWAIHWPLRLCAVAGTVYVLMQSQLTRWTTFEKIGWLGGIGVTMLAVWFLLHQFAKRSMIKADSEDTGATRLLVFTLGATAGAIGAATIASGSITGGQLTASLAAAVCGGWLATLGGRAGPISYRGVVDIIFPPSFGLLVYSWYFAWQIQNPASAYIVAGLLAVAPLGLWVTALPWVRYRPPGQRTILGLFAVFLLISAALGLAGYEDALRNQASGPSYY